MNKKILTIAITCSFCFLLITNYVVADKPEWAGKPEGIVKQQAEKAKEEAERKAAKEARKAERKAAKEAKKAAKKINE
jgi:membrane protein involved in colicin uptake